MPCCAVKLFSESHDVLTFSYMTVHIHALRGILVRGGILLSVWSKHPWLALLNPTTTLPPYSELSPLISTKGMTSENTPRAPSCYQHSILLRSTQAKSGARCSCTPQTTAAAVHYFGTADVGSPAELCFGSACAARVLDVWVCGSGGWACWSVEVRAGGGVFPSIAVWTESGALRDTFRAACVGMWLSTVISFVNCVGVD